MATTTFRRDYLGRKLVTPGTNSLDYMGRVTTSTTDAVGRSLVAVVRANTTAYTIGTQVEFTSGELFIATAGGTSAAAQPSVPANGATVADGTVTWLRLQ